MSYKKKKLWITFKYLNQNDYAANISKVNNFLYSINIVSSTQQLKG